LKLKEETQDVRLSYRRNGKVIEETIILRKSDKNQGYYIKKLKSEIEALDGSLFKNGKINWENCHYVTKDRYDQDRNIQLKENDVLVTKDGTIGKIALISFIPQPTTLNSGVFVIRPTNNAFDPKCFYYLLSSVHFDEFLAQLAAGSTISHLYQKDFVNFKFKLPSQEAQKEIGSILFDVDSDIEIYEKKLQKARFLKQGMMQQLVVGRIRLA